MPTDEAGAVYLKRQSEDYAQTGLVKISTASEYVWGDALLAEPEENSLMQAFVGAGNKIYTTGITCGETDCGVYLARYSQGESGDTTAPAAVTDLRVTQVSSYSLTLAWTAPGDDGSGGAASSYDMRYNIGVAIENDAAFESAAKVSGLPAPAAAGSVEQFVVDGLSAGATYYFALKTADEAGNISALSNSPAGITAAARKYGVKISTGNWQIVEVSTWSAPMGSLVAVFGGSEAVEKLPLEFSISTFPVGATGQELSKSSETTSAGLADVLLNLGNIPAEYGVTATCRDCEASASSVTFTCCGKLPNDDFKQGDLKWNTTYYDNICSTTPPNSGYRPVYSCDASIFNKPEYKNKKYNFTIKAKGCGLTALSTLINYYRETYGLTISSTTPESLNRFLKDNARYGNKCYSISGAVNFECVTSYSSNLKLSGAMDYPNYSRKQLIDKAKEDILKGFPVILKISNSTHFVLAVGVCNGKFIVSDPGSSLSERKVYDPEGDRALIGIRKFGKIK